MLKRRFLKKNSIFKKKKQINFYIEPACNLIYSTNKSIINLVKITKWLKKTYKRFKKRNIRLYLKFQNNLVRTFKSKNARMGKGKGGLRRYTSQHTSRILASTELSSVVLHRKLYLSFKKLKKNV